MYSSGAELVRIFLTAIYLCCALVHYKLWDSWEVSLPEKVGELMVCTHLPTFSGRETSMDLIIVNSTFTPPLTVPLDIKFLSDPKTTTIWQKIRTPLKRILMKMLPTFAWYMKNLPSYMKLLPSLFASTLWNVCLSWWKVCLYAWKCLPGWCKLSQLQGFSSSRQALSQTF